VRKSRKKRCQSLIFFVPQIWGKAQKFGGGAFVYRQYFRPTGQVWLRFHGWSFIYVDEMKKSAVKYNGLAFGGHKNILHIACGPFKACGPPQLRILRGCKHGIVHSYLFNRVQRVRLPGELSTWTTLSGGMPQGSWLSFMIWRLAPSCTSMSIIDDNYF